MLGSLTPAGSSEITLGIKTAQKPYIVIGPKALIYESLDSWGKASGSLWASYNRAVNLLTANLSDPQPKSYNVGTLKIRIGLWGYLIIDIEKYTPKPYSNY